MKKKMMFLLLIITMLLFPVKINALNTTEAKDKIDTSRTGTLALSFVYDDLKFNNIEVKLYHIANFTEDYQFEMTSNFASYKIKLNGLKTDEEWNSVKETLDSYIEADAIDSDDVKSISNNSVLFTGLTPGLYYVKVPVITTDKYILRFENLLISVPELYEDGTWNYEVKAFPKAESYEPIYEEVRYSVVKVWKDKKWNRPNNVNIEIYKDGQLIEKVTLSSDNNWSYSWVALEDGSSWKVVERNVPKGYTVSIRKNNYKFIVVNSDEPDNPRTGDNINLYMYLFVASLSGLALLSIGLVLKDKKNSNEN